VVGKYVGLVALKVQATCVWLVVAVGAYVGPTHELADALVVDPGRVGDVDGRRLGVVDVGKEVCAEHHCPSATEGLHAHHTITWERIPVEHTHGAVDEVGVPSDGEVLVVQVLGEDAVLRLANNTQRMWLAFAIAVGTDNEIRFLPLGGLRSIGALA